MNRYDLFRFGLYTFILLSLAATLLWGLGTGIFLILAFVGTMYMGAIIYNLYKFGTITRPEEYHSEVEPEESQ